MDTSDNTDRIFKTGVIFLLFSFLTACGQKKGEYKSPAFYDLNRPEKFIMPESLLEISGIEFDKGNSDTVYAQQDEKGYLYRLKPGDRTVRYTKYGKDGDYEDLAIAGDDVVMLRSDGTFFSFSLSSAREEKISGVKEWKKILPRGEYESLFADPASGALYVLCKQCRDDKEAEAVSGYILAFQPGVALTVTGNFSISVKDIAVLLKDKKVKFRPSALARNPASGEWYIVSSVSKLLVVTDGDFKIKEVYRLNPKLFLQPEGIAFDRDNNLYISNEGSKIKPADILKFKQLK